MEPSESHEDLKRWCVIAIGSVGSLWDAARSSAWRDSHERKAGATRFRPTVTLNAINAFAEYGLLGSRSPPVLAGTESLRVDPVTITARFLDAVRPLGGGNWFDGILSTSAHGKGARSAILISHLFAGLRNLAEAGLPPVSVIEIDQGGEKASESLVRLIETAGDPTATAAVASDLSVAERLASNPRFSPDLSLYVAQAFVDRRSFRRALGLAATGIDPRIERVEGILRRYFEREADRLMARHGIPTDSAFDPVSLVFALRGLFLLSPSEFRQTDFFRACVNAVIAGQNRDGTWPDGVSALEDEGRDTLQHPSVKVAVTLADVVFDLKMLTRFTSHEIATLSESTAALRRTADHLASTYYAGDGPISGSGWVSDRVRWPQTSEMWINALVAQLYLRVHFATQAIERAAILAEFTARWPDSSARDPDARLNHWTSDVVEPDEITVPCELLCSRIIAPIIDQQKRELAVIQPSQTGVSVLLYGPPGSGKTYLVKQLAATLDWPLVELNPGTFLTEGTEFIEYRARQVFETLIRLRHAVVFFDECDELLLDREQQDPGNRNILSFVTACMLPKFQELHDARTVIFVVATNYVARIDKAIRRPGRVDLLLLYDRPDQRARRAILTKQWATITPAPPVADIDGASSNTNGLTTTEVLAYAKKRDPRAPVPPGTRNDYIDWCISCGDSELAAGRLEPTQKQRVQERWSRIPGYVEALKGKKP